ncbi:MAG: hypothetical protein HY897_13720 [Deltaproteobacteria bacterium]|nr:hypothetical protein [Deltaproteobacteria bacterium]
MLIIVAGVAAVVAAGASAQAAEVSVFLPGADGAAAKVEKLPGDDRHGLSLVIGAFSWPPADCADICVTFESFEKSAGRRGTLMRLFAKQAGFRRDREVDFLPQVSADEIRAHTDTILIIVHSILHEVAIPPAEIPLPKPKETGPALLNTPVPPEKKREKPADASAEQRLPPPAPYAFPVAAMVGADWLGDNMLAPAIGFDVAARLPPRIALSLDYRYRFPAAFYVGDFPVSAGGQRYILGLGAALPRFRSLDTFVLFSPAVESVEIESETEGRRYRNLLLLGAEVRAYYRARPSLGMFVSAAAHYATNKITVEFQQDGASWETARLSLGVQAGMFFEIAPSPR